MDKVTTLLFDIDGTLLDTTEFILQATEHTLSSLGYAVPDRELIKSKVGIPFPQYYLELGASAPDADKAVDMHRGFQYKNYHLVQPFPGTVETLHKLKEKGYKLGAISSRSNKTTHQTLQDSGIFEIFETILSFEDTKNLKPHPEPVLKALEKMNEVPERAVMIGDSHFDIEAGKNAGTKTIRVTYGFHNDKLYDPEPDFVINDIKELLKIL